MVSVLERTKTGSTRLTAGLELTHFLLHPGETVRTPRIVIMPWTGDRTTAHNRWCRLLLFHYVPQSSGRPTRLPIALQCFDRYSFTRTDWATEAGQSELATEHPEFVLAGQSLGLYKLNDPTARRYLTDLLSKRIAEYGVDLYRNDFNIDPLTYCFPGHPERNQVQTANLGQYIPRHAAGPWTPAPNDFRSAATSGAALQCDYLAPGFPMELAKAAIAEAKANQKYWYGDFYPLAGAAVAADHFVAYQFHRADLNEGLVLAFRHEECDTTGISVAIRGLDPCTTYKIEFSNEARHPTSTTMTGSELQTGLRLRIPDKGASLIARYKPVV